MKWNLSVLAQNGAARALRVDAPVRAYSPVRGCSPMMGLLARDGAYAPEMGVSAHEAILHWGLLARDGADTPGRDCYCVDLVVLVGMDIASKFTSLESIRCFREEPHYFYMYANVIQTLNLWFPLTYFEDTILRLLNVAPSQFHLNSWAFVKVYELLCNALDLEPSLGVFFSFYHVKTLTPGRLVLVCAQPNKGLFKLFASNFKNYQDSFFRVRYGPQLSSLMYDTDGDYLFSFYWTEDPRAIKGVYDDVLTSFEKETITFLESFNLIDIKDLLRRETNVKRITNFIRRMKTVSDEEWMSYLAKSKAKKLQSDDIALPDDLLVVGETKGSKQKRRGDKVIRGDKVRPSQMATQDVGSFSPVANVAFEVSVSYSPQPNGGRALRSHSTGVIQTEDVQMDEFVVDGGVTFQTAGPPPAVAGIGSFVWGSSFDPAAFVESTLLGAGDLARFDSLTTSELRNLALSYEVKGTTLTHLLSARRDKEILEASSKKQWADEVDHLKKTHQEALAEVRGAHACDVAGLRKKHADEKASLQTKAAILEAEETTLEVLRNNLIVSLTQSRKDVSELEEDVDELEETNAALKQSMDDKYVDGFWSSIEQVKILFPELDPDMLAQVDVLKRIKDGKLI
ncbi:hypothetical protein TSUD_365560 [Trifolium subterraneum]|uniref:Uncharacterized protein n=1 Tax=Trifolium subterraneum TaxID=3900 RepID=A0A2Z6MG62_TRISU|nr:hypothetical protein TSUD_365560 [Trifolium subterraneum]